MGFDEVESKIQQGTGQITTFNQLGFKGINDKPDGWYLPDDHNMPAIILETKSDAEDISLQKWVDELVKNCNIVATKYKQVVGILYNESDIRVFKNNVEENDVSTTFFVFYSCLRLNFGYKNSTYRFDRCYFKTLHII